MGMKVHRNCCGLDVHKETIAACVLHDDSEGRSAKEKRLFGTVTQELKALSQWLHEHNVTAVAMEASGVYWVPVWNVLEGEGLHLVLINPEHYKAIRGKKTDMKDGERIAELLQDGRLQGSYVPSGEVRRLRDLTRYRTKLVQHQSALSNRIQKLLEQGNIKLASVASDVLDVSGRAMLEAMARGENDPVKLADMAKMQLRRKLDALRLALDGCLLPFPAARDAGRPQPRGGQDRSRGSGDRASDAAVSKSPLGMDVDTGNQTAAGVGAGGRDRT